MSTSRPPSKPYELDITIISAKHLKNVNWRQGDLKPYAIFWVDPDRRLATKSDDSGSTRPVWNERFVLPLSIDPDESLFTLEIFHSKPLETPKPLVGILRFPLKDLTLDSDDSNKIRTFELRRPSGRPHGKIRLKLSVRERPSPDYHFTPPPNYYYSTAPPPPPQRPLPPPPAPTYPYGGYSDPYSSYYHGGYYSQPPPPPRPFFDRQSVSGGPSAPAYSPISPDYNPVSLNYTPPYSQKANRSQDEKMGLGSGLAVGAVAGALGGLVLEEGLKYEEEKLSDRTERELAGRDDYSDYRADY
jgi:hypothetical protein